MKFTIEAELIRAAMACQAKNDVRYYLNGILITASGDVVGLDGHIAFRGNHTWRDDDDSIIDDLILEIDGTIPLAAVTVTFEINDSQGFARIDSGKLFSVNVIDGKYPNYERVIPCKKSDLYSTVLYLNVSLLAKAERVFGKGAFISMYHRGPDNSILIECKAMTGAVLVMMPLKDQVEGEKLILATED